MYHFTTLLYIKRLKYIINSIKILKKLLTIKFRYSNILIDDISRSEESLKIKTKPAIQPVRDNKKSHTTKYQPISKPDTNR